MTGVELAGLAASAAVVAIVELDAAAAGQFMLSRPLVLGPCLGAALGEPLHGWALGALYELFHLRDLPVGGHLPANATVAVGVGLLLAAAPTAVPVALAFPAGIAAGRAHRRLEAALRARRSRLAAICDARVAEGRDPRLAVLLLRQLALQAGATLALLAVAISLKPGLHWAWWRAPEALQRGLLVAYGAAAWVGLAALLRAARIG